jgi:hypothetical protein
MKQLTKKEYIKLKEYLKEKVETDFKTNELKERVLLIDEICKLRQKWKRDIPLSIIEEVL